MLLCKARAASCDSHLVSRHLVHRKYVVGQMFAAEARAAPPPTDSPHACKLPACRNANTITSHIMADNVGLTTPRGSGTSGYVQKNRSLLRPRDKVAPYQKDLDHARHRPRQPDAEILEHEAKRDIEVKVFELRDKLEEEG